LGKAIGYLVKHSQAPTLFLRQPGAPLDNNIAERALKKASRHGARADAKRAGLRVTRHSGCRLRPYRGNLAGDIVAKTADPSDLPKMIS
jgi:hypothetical protein